MHLVRIHITQAAQGPYSSVAHKMSLQSCPQLRTTLPCALQTCLALRGQRLSLTACDGSVLMQRAVQLPGAGLLQCIVPEGCRALHTDAVQVAGRHRSWSSSLCVPGLPAGLNVHSFHIDGPFITCFPAPGSGALRQTCMASSPTSALSDAFLHQAHEKIKAPQLISDILH